MEKSGRVEEWQAATRLRILISSIKQHGMHFCCGEQPMLPVVYEFLPHVAKCDRRLRRKLREKAALESDLIHYCKRVKAYLHFIHKLEYFIGLVHCHC